ncbi:MAG TPA: DUF362 domain-containing protein [Desulfobacteria bacterium]|nr:DUF362 domain-containing protein [Desulfobacteria bacterium]
MSAVVQVSMVKCPDYRQNSLAQALERGIQPLGGWQKFLHSGDKVLLKVNLIGPCPPDKAATTHPELVRVLIQICRAHGCEVWVGDSAGGAIAGLAPTAKGLRVAGFETVAAEEGATLVNFDQTGAVEVPSKTKRFVDKFYLAKPVRDADVVINLPKFKAHSAAVFTGAVKNVFGCIPGLRKAEYHRLAPNSEEFGEIIADIHLACRVSLNIMDAVVGMEGAGPTAGDPVQLGYLLLSPDALALDTVAITALGLKLQDVPILEQAVRLGVGQADLTNIQLCGDFRQIPRITSFKIPRTVRKRRSGLMLKGVIRFFKVRPRINAKLCKHCQVCVGSCPVEAIEPKTKNIDYQRCIECLCCHELCPNQAVILKRSNPVARAVLPLAGRIHRHGT